MENETIEEIKDPQGLLKAYNQAKADIVALREENKSLKSQVETEVPDQWKAKALAAEIKSAIKDLGVKNAERLLPLIGTEGIDFDESGKVTGLTARINALKADLPELFDPKHRVGGRADIFADNPVGKTLSASEIQANALLGR